MIVAKKHFGQHFLISDYVIDYIIDYLNVKKTDNLVEIGAGLGALTKPLLTKLNQLNVVEIDHDMIAVMQTWQADNLTIHHENILTFDLSKLGNGLRVVGNLPYNISSAILLRLLDNRQSIEDMCLMLQKEVAERIVAKPNNRQYGRLSVMLQSYYDMELPLTITADNFQPAPKVDSSLIYLKPKKKIPDVDINTLSFIVKLAFSKRRKTLKNALKSILDKISCPFDFNQRAEMLSSDDFITLTKHYEGKEKNQ